MKHITGILLYNSFIEPPGLKQTFGQKQGHFSLTLFSLGAHQAGRKEHAT